MLGDNKIGEKILVDFNICLDKPGLMTHGGTIVIASLLATQISIKNQEGKCDSEMHHTKNSNEWYFVMKVHASADVGRKQGELINIRLDQWSCVG